MTAEEYVIKLTQLSVNKLDLLKEILFITKSQSAVISEDSIEALQKNIDAKQLTINQIDIINEDFNSYVGRLKAILGIQSFNQVKSTDIKGLEELHQVMEMINNTVDEIQNFDKQNNKNANEVLNKLGSEIRKIAQGKIASNAYKGSQYNTIAATTSYFDTKK